MHPALYVAVVEARQADLRRARRYDSAVRRTREPRRRFSFRIALRSRRLARA
jgi:hypothetical protein